MNHVENDLADGIEPMETNDEVITNDLNIQQDNMSENAMDTKENEVIDEPMNAEEDRSRSEAVFRHVFKNISKMKDSVLSDPCYVRDLPWKIMVMLRSSNSQDKTSQKALGVFLQCNAESESQTWSCFANAELRLIPQYPFASVFERRIQHMFYSKENDWGFSHFMTFSEVLDPEKGFWKDDSIIIEVHVAADAPHGVSWDSKKHTGYVGLKNQGATCYMNSLLQTLYFTNQLRKAVYKMPTESDDSIKSVALALQRVFHELQFSDKPVGTKKLTKSFGWETLDSFMQHDVQEFLRVLLDKLESKMKGTCVEGTVPKLFEGKMISYIKCKNIDYTSSRIETYYDIQLNIKGKRHIYDSFNDYVSRENLEGDNKYDAGEHGLQDAEKGVTFSSFPPVLHLHLMRFQYDPLTDCSVKFNDRFEFFDHINLDRYLEKPEDTPADYTLHAVLVHSGDNHGGHYVVFINPLGDGIWCKFDDDVVSRCSRQEAIDNNFGGQDEDLNIAVKHCTNAYMLVYVRDSQLSTVLQEVTKNDIPSELADRLAEERKIEQIRRKEKNESHMYITITLIMEDSFEWNLGNELFDLDHAVTVSIKEKKSTTIADFLERLSSYFNYPVHLIRLWPLKMRKNNVQRPTFFDVNLVRCETIHDVLDSPSNAIFLELLLPPLSSLSSINADLLEHQYQQKLNQDYLIPEFRNNEHVLLFFKYYNPKMGQIHYCGHQYVSKNAKYYEIATYLNKLIGFPENNKLIFYEEQRNNFRIRTMSDPLQCEDSELMNGDVLIFEKAEKDGDYELPNCTDYFNDYFSRVEVQFVDKNLQNDQGFVISLSQNANYNQIIKTVSDHVGVAPHLLQLFRNQSFGFKDTVTQPIKCSFEGTLKEIVGSCRQKTAKKLFYQQLTIPITELEDKKQFKCIFVDPNLKEEKEIILYPNKSGTVSDLLEEAKKQITFSEDSNGALRILELSNCRLNFGPRLDELLEHLSMSSIITYRIEEIPKDELLLKDDELLISCAHFYKDPYSLFGIPFILKVRDNEKFETIKERIQKKLNISEKEIEKYKFAVVQNNKPLYISDDDTMKIASFKSYTRIRPWLGLDHVNKAPKRSRFNCLEKAIKIYN